MAIRSCKEMLNAEQGESFKGAHQNENNVRIRYFETQIPKTEFRIHEFMKINVE